MASFFRSKGKSRNKDKGSNAEPLEFTNQTITKSFDNLLPYNSLVISPYDTVNVAPVPPFELEYPEDPENMSLSEANTIIKKQKSRIEDLERAVKERDAEIEQLKAHLDMTRSVLSFHDLEHNKDPSVAGSPNAGVAGEPKASVFKQRGIGISAEPTANVSLSEIKLIKHEKTAK